MSPVAAHSGRTTRNGIEGGRELVGLVIGRDRFVRGPSGRVQREDDKGDHR